MTKDQALAVVQREIEKAGNQKAFAEKHGISQAFLSDMLKGKRALSPKVLGPVGLEMVEVYRKVQ